MFKTNPKPGFWFISKLISNHTRYLIKEGLNRGHERKERENEGIIKAHGESTRNQSQEVTEQRKKNSEEPKTGKCDESYLHFFNMLFNYMQIKQRCEWVSWEEEMIYWEIIEVSRVLYMFYIKWWRVVGFWMRPYTHWLRSNDEAAFCEHNKRSRA